MMRFKDYFYGNKISEYGRKNGRVDYATLAKAFDAVLNNNIMSATGYEFWEQESGQIDNQEEIDSLQEELDELESGKRHTESGIYFVDEDGEEITGDAAEEIDSRISELEEQIAELEAEQDEQQEIFQYYIVSDNGAEILKEFGEIVFYNSELDMYVWGVTHYGTSWSYVLTDIECERDETARA